MGRHSQRLPPKSFKVAPGDVVGGLIFVMDKPLGIEEGMIGISIDNPGYREFVEKKLTELEENPNQNSALAKRFRKLVNAHPNFSQLDRNAQIDLLIADKKHVKKRYGISKEDLSKIFLSFSKLHEVKLLQSYYVNKGMGGLLFKSYKTECEVKTNEPFYKQIGALLKNSDPDNKVYMVKQDGKKVLGGTGPGFQKILKTNTGKKIQRLANPWVVAATGGISALAFGAIMLGWRASYLKNNKPQSANADAIVEALSTKLAQTRGFPSQEIDTIEGTYKDGSPKIATIVTWAAGCKDLSEKLRGSDDYTSTIVHWDESGKIIKQDLEGNVFKQKTDPAGNEIYEKIDLQGSRSEVTKEEYDNAPAISNDSIRGLGESLATFLCFGDRDGIGKVGQNKAIRPLDPADGNIKYEFFGIDFGKSFRGDNPIIGTVKDDFSFTNPASIQERFVNMSALYDNPLREKMKGIYLIGAMRDKLSAEECITIAKEYENSGDKLFAMKLLAVANNEKNTDVRLINKEIAAYQEKIEQSPDKVSKQEYQSHITRLEEVLSSIQANDAKLLSIFEKRLHLTPTQIDILDNIEKLTAQNAHTFSPNNQVALNHIRVENADRIAWQLRPNLDNTTFTLSCSMADESVIERLRKANIPLLNGLALDNGNISIVLRKEDIQDLSQALTEEKVAAVRNLSYRNNEVRAHLHQQLHSATSIKESSTIELSSTSHLLETQQQVPNTVTPQNKSQELEKEAPTTRPKALHSHLNIQNNRLQSLQPQTPVAIQTNQSLQQVKSHLESNENRKKYDIQAVKDLSQDNTSSSIKILLKNPENQNKINVIAHENSVNKAVQYSLKKELPQDDYVFAVTKICALAVHTAKPGTEFNLSKTPLDKQPIIANILQNLIQEGITKNRFTTDNAPQIRGLPDTKNTKNATLSF